MHGACVWLGAKTDEHFQHCAAESVDRVDAVALSEALALTPEALDSRKFQSQAESDAIDCGNAHPSAEFCEPRLALLRPEVRIRARHFNAFMHRNGFDNCTGRAILAALNQNRLQPLVKYRYRSRKKLARRLRDCGSCS